MRHFMLCCLRSVKLVANPKTTPYSSRHGQRISISTFQFPLSPCVYAKDTSTQRYRFPLNISLVDATTMSRLFSSSTAKAVGQWLGYGRENLTPKWEKAVSNFTEPGGSAEKKLGKIKSVTIKWVVPRYLFAITLTWG